MEAADAALDDNTRKRKRRFVVSTAELYAVLEALLPFAEIEIECVASYVKAFPEDDDHTIDAVRAQQGMAALEASPRMIAKKSANIRRKQRALEGVATASPRPMGNASPESRKSDS